MCLELDFYPQMHIIASHETSQLSSMVLAFRLLLPGNLSIMVRAWPSASNVGRLTLLSCTACHGNALSGGWLATVASLTKATLLTLTV